MKKIVLLCLILASFYGLFAQTGTVNDQYTINSEILGEEMHYSVYLPTGYERSVRSYPVLYLLHGMGGNHSSWIEDGEVNRIASQIITSGDAPEMIIIMPQGKNYFYVNSYDNSARYEDYFIEEFIPHVENEFRIMKRRNKRAIAGLSMGGYGTLYHALKHQDIFGACYALSAATGVYDRRTDEEKEQTKEYDETHSIIEIVKNLEYDPESREAYFFPAMFIDCGDDDFLILQNQELFKELKEKKIPFEFRTRDGGHTWIYWKSGLPTAMEFVGAVFRR